MAKFGADSHFGGDSNFGGDESRLVKYYRALKSLDPPGVYKDDDESLHYHLTRADALALGNTQSMLDHLELELFPHSCEQTIAEWELSYGISPKPMATIQNRRNAAISRWRANLSSSPEHIRMALASILNPEHAFWDRHDDSTVSPSYTQIAGNGAIAEASTLSMDTDADDCDWSEAEQTIPRLLLPIVDRTDDVYMLACIDAVTGAEGSIGGVCLYADATNAVVLELTQEASTTWYVTPWVISDGTKSVGTRVEVTEEVNARASSIIWLQVSRVGSTYQYHYGFDRGSLTLLTSVSYTAMPATPKYVGVWAGCRAADSYPDTVFEFNNFIVRYGKQYNNVELFETPVDIVVSAEDIFRAYVHRDPEDSGEYDIDEAQRLCDRIKQGHTLLYVIESDCFKCDDPYSLTDRDILGS